MTLQDEQTPDHPSVRRSTWKHLLRTFGRQCVSNGTERQQITEPPAVAFISRWNNGSSEIDFFFFFHLRKITSEAIITIKKKPKNFSFSPLDYSCSAHKDFSNCTLEIKSHQHSLCVITQSACVGRGGFKITLLLYKTLKGSWFRLSVIACLTRFPAGVELSLSHIWDGKVALRS